MQVRANVRANLNARSATQLEPAAAAQPPPCDSASIPIPSTGARGTRGAHRKKGPGQTASFHSPAAGHSDAEESETSGGLASLSLGPKHPFGNTSSAERVFARRPRREHLEDHLKRKDLREQGAGIVMTKMEEFQARMQDLQDTQDFVKMTLLELRRDVRWLHRSSKTGHERFRGNVKFESGEEADDVVDEDKDNASEESSDDDRKSFAGSAELRAASYTGSLLADSIPAQRKWRVDTNPNMIPKFCGLDVRLGFEELSYEVGEEGGNSQDVMKRSETEQKLKSIFAASGKQSTAMLGSERDRKSSRMRKLTGSWVQACLPIHPDSAVRLWLDLFSMLVLLFDSISVPYQLSFSPDTSTGFWNVANWVTLLVWTCDLFVGFVTGYYDKGGPVMEFRSIASHYFRTYFFIDFATVGCDWFSAIITIILVDDSNAAKGGSTATMLKLFRILKLNRLLRLLGALQSGKFGQMYDRIINWSQQLGFDTQLQFSLNITQLTFLILWLNHIGCCSWFAIQSTAVQNWELDNAIEEVNPGITEAMEWMYFINFYWSMTSMVSGAAIMAPTNIGELVFTIIYVLFGLLVGSTLISSLAAMLLDLQMANKEERDQVRQLRQYMYQQGLDVGLSLDVEKEVMERMSQEKRLRASEVLCLNLLSPAMRSALHYAIYSRPLKTHSFLGACHVLQSSFSREICETAVQHNTVDPGTQVFTKGMTADGPFYIVLGHFEYRVKALGPEASKSDEDLSRLEESVAIASPSSPGRERSLRGQRTKSTFLSSDEWLCELATWLRWEHLGTLAACVPCEYFVLKADLLLKILNQFEVLRGVAYEYAQALCSAAESDLAHRTLTDLPLQDDFHESVVFSMKPQGRRIMSTAALEFMTVHGLNERRGYLPFSRSHLKDLMHQVDEGKCDLVIQKGQVLRVVSVVTMRLEREGVNKNGQRVRQILAQIGKCGKAELGKDSKCQLPGCKVRAGELPDRAMERFLQTQMADLQKAGLQKDMLIKMESAVELTEDALAGSTALAVSSIADLHEGDLVHLGEGRSRETRVIVAVDVHQNTVQVDKPLVHHYEQRARIFKAGDVKTNTNSAVDYGVDTKYIKSIYYCQLDSLQQDVGIPLLRRERESAQSLHHIEEAEHDPTDHPAFLLPAPVTDSGFTTGKSFASRQGHRTTMAASGGIMCAWMDVSDFVLLSKKEGQHLVKDWVNHLEAADQHGARDIDGQQLSRDDLQASDVIDLRPIEDAVSLRGSSPPRRAASRTDKDQGVDRGAGHARAQPSDANAMQSI